MTKSKSRIAEFGEVFTSEREVKDMLDLVEDETFRIDSRFLEPACGDGNFLVEVLRRKLSIVRARYANSQLEYERNCFASVSSSYGIDVLEDNVRECRRRLMGIAKQEYYEIFKDRVNPAVYSSLELVLELNVIHGDALTLKIANSERAIVFSEWCFATGSKVRRTDYSFNNLLAYQPFEEDSLFSDLGDEAFLPAPHKSYPLTHFMELADVCE